MLLAIAHHNGQLIRISLDRMLLSVHRAQPEHCSLSPIAAHTQGHRYRVTEGAPRSNGLSQFAGSETRLSLPSSQNARCCAFVVFTRA
jgi:hypothetical protein